MWQKSKTTFTFSFNIAHTINMTIESENSLARTRRRKMKKKKLLFMWKGSIFDIEFILFSVYLFASVKFKFFYYSDFIAITIAHKIPLKLMLMTNMLTYVCMKKSFGRDFYWFIYQKLIFFSLRDNFNLEIKCGFLISTK